MKKVKYILIGALIGTILASSVAFAGGQFIEVFYVINDIVINKVSNMPEERPFVYDGRTYVPLRYVAEALGEEVGWDGSTGTVYIGEMEEETAVYIGNGIDYMNYQEGYSSHKFNIEYDGTYADNIGNTYNSCVEMNVSGYGSESDAWNYLVFPTNGQFDSFKATLALTDDKKNTTSSITFEVYADDVLIYTKNLVAGTMPQNIELDISNAIKVKFKMKTDANTAEIGLFDARFIK